MMGHKVLTVDDDLAIRRLIKIVLEMDGHEVIEAIDGFECLEKVQKESIDLILLDINMPGINGWEVLRTIRNIPGLSMIPTILVSGESPNHRLIRELNPTAFVRKPFDIEELAARVKECLATVTPQLNCA